MDFIVKLAEGFIGLFQAGAKNLTGLITGMVPLLLVLLTAINALIKFVGQERITDFSKKLTRFRVLRYTLLPVIALFFLTNPMCYTLGQLLEEKYKPAFFDSGCALAHPMLGLFPHINPAELFVWAGIASGVTTLGLSSTPLAVRYFIVGIIVAFIRGNATEFATNMLMKRKEAAKS